MAIDVKKIGSVVEQYMTDVITIVRPAEDAKVSIDPVTLEVVMRESHVYSGKAFVAPMGSPSDQTIGDVAKSRLYYEVAIPYDEAVTIQPQDVVRIIKSADSALKTRALVITGVIPTTFITHRRLSAYLDVLSS